MELGKKIKRYVTLCYLESEEEFRFRELEKKEKEQLEQQILSSLKLQELVKERIEQITPVNSTSDDYDEFIILQSLIHESEK